MIQNKNFWTVELDAPLLNRNDGYITCDSVKFVTDKALDWFASVQERGQIPNLKWQTSCEHEESQRIFELDAERTFKYEEHRRDLIETLSTLHHYIKDYHQGMSFIVSFLLLFLDKEKVASLVLGLHLYYVEGYFKSAPVAYVRDAKVFEEMLQIYYPDVYKHIVPLVPSEAYCSKWFVGFHVHVLPFTALAKYLDHFFISDQLFRFQFALSLVKNTKNDLLKTKDVGKILETLRLDSSRYPDTKILSEKDSTILSSENNSKIVSPSSNSFESSLLVDTEQPGSFFMKIVTDAIDFNVDRIDLERIRDTVNKRMAQELLKRQLRESQLAQEDDDEIVFSDEEE